MWKHPNGYRSQGIIVDVQIVFAYIHVIAVVVVTVAVVVVVVVSCGDGAATRPLQLCGKSISVAALGSS